MTDLSEVRDVWESLARHDAMRAILDAPGRSNDEPNAWTVEEFLATGEQTVDHVLGLAALAGLAVRFGSALDFGCGVGRLSLALGRRFESVVGVDIAEGMLDVARRLDADDRVQFVLNDEPDLRLLGDSRFDFILSLIVLQHVEPRFSVLYIREFCRLLEPGGLAMFQVAGSPLATRRPWRRRWWRFGRTAIVPQMPAGPEMHGLEPERVIEVVEEGGKHVSRMWLNEWAGPGWSSFLYAVCP